MLSTKRYHGFAAVTVLLLLSLPAVAVRHSAGIWYADVNSAWQVTQSSGRPLLLLISSDGCRYCYQMKRHTLRDRGVLSDLQRSFVAAEVGRGQYPDLQQQLGVRTYPTTVVIGPDGRVWDSIRGYVGPEQLRGRLRATIQKHTRVNELSQR